MLPVTLTLVIAAVSAEAARGFATLTIIFAIVCGSAVLYMAPTIIAVKRRHRQVWPIVVINIFLGWTFIGWVVSLAMSASAPRQPI